MALASGAGRMRIVSGTFSVSHRPVGQVIFARQLARTYVVKTLTARKSTILLAPSSTQPCRKLTDESADFLNPTTLKQFNLTGNRQTRLPPSSRPTVRNHPFGVRATTGTHSYIDLWWLGNVVSQHQTRARQIADRRCGMALTPTPKSGLT
jgi:hypothetical protein